MTTVLGISITFNAVLLFMLIFSYDEAKRYKHCLIDIHRDLQHLLAGCRERVREVEAKLPKRGPNGRFIKREAA